jgi:hypothetical protein
MDTNLFLEAGSSCGFYRVLGVLADLDDGPLLMVVAPPYYAFVSESAAFSLG